MRSIVLGLSILIGRLSVSIFRNIRWRHDVIEWNLYFEKQTRRRKFHFVMEIPEASTPPHFKNLWKWFIAHIWNSLPVNAPSLKSLRRWFITNIWTFHFVILRNIMYFKYLLIGKWEMVRRWFYHMVFMGRELDSEIIFEVCCSGKKSIFQNVHKIWNFSIRSVTQKFSEHFQRMGPRNSRSSTPITL